ncbi:MAG TPA: metalloregulator ArsR/SmtB family transcription factor [Thermoplasmata archaeon]|nr:metalloregulator ArsR/SmtB family transcription factor [Thermoplasmata archaeon]
MTDAPDLAHGTGHSSAKRAILLGLKRSGEADLDSIAGELGVSKVAALRHLGQLEHDGLVQRSYRPGGVGRPRVRFRLTPSAARLFPEAYAKMSLCALQFIERSLGRDAVVRMLQERTHEVAAASRPRLGDAPLAERVATLAQIRKEGGYMAELGARRARSVEMLEHNCPILAIAEQYPEACDVERRMFETLLGARVDTSHRVVAGDAVCRFVVRPREARP